MGFILLGVIIGLIVVAVRLAASRDLRKAEVRTLQSARNRLRKAEERSLKTGKPVAQSVLTRAQRAEMQAQAWANTLPQQRSTSPVMSPTPAAAPATKQASYEVRVESYRNAKDSERPLKRLGKAGWEVVGTDRAYWMTTSKPYSVTLRRLRATR